MEIELFTLCDAAADYQGRLSILGIFDTIFAPNLPAVHPHCAIAVRLRLHRTEQGKHSLILHIVDHDGRMVVPELKGDFEIQLAGDTRVGMINLVLNLQGLSFNNFGEYAINLAIDSHELDSLPFWVRQQP
jgi:hypothetical protein